MKPILISIVTLLVISACGTANKSLVNETSPKTRSYTTAYGEVSLEDIINKAGGVTVRGSGAEATVRVFVGNSFGNTSEPLFLVNGSAFGDSFSSLQTAINPFDVKEVRVYKSAAELGPYGARGANGVINIILK